MNKKTKYMVQHGNILISVTKNGYDAHLRYAKYQGFEWVVNTVYHKDHIEKTLIIIE